MVIKYTYKVYIHIYYSIMPIYVVYTDYINLYIYTAYVYTAYIDVLLLRNTWV